MSVTFTEVAVGSQRSLRVALGHIGDRMLELAFAPREAAQFRYDPEEEAFADAASVTVPALPFFRADAELDENGGLLVVFANQAQEVVLRLGRQPDGSLITFLDFTDRTLYGFFANRQIDLLHRLLAACAGGIAARVAFGALELEWKPYTEQAALSAVRQGPEGYQGKPPPFGLLRQHDFSRAMAGAIAGSEFELLEVGEYWLLQRQGLAASFAAFKR